MDFGVSQLALMTALDESHRSCTSLDDGALEDLHEEVDEAAAGAGREKSRRGLLLLLSWQ
jgi:hypothetical protein